MRLFYAAILLALSFFVLLMCGCAPVRHEARFIAPSTAAVSESVATAKTSNRKAIASIADASAKLKQVPLNISPALKDVVDDLTNADVDLRDTDAKLVVAERQVVTLHSQVETLTDNANKDVDKYNTLADKYSKCLKQLWSWRIKGLFFIILSILVFAGTLIWKLGLFGVKAAVKAVIP